MHQSSPATLKATWCDSVADKQTFSTVLPEVRWGSRRVAATSAWPASFRLAHSEGSWGAAVHWGSFSQHWGLKGDPGRGWWLAPGHKGKKKLSFNAHYWQHKSIAANCFDYQVISDVVALGKSWEKSQQELTRKRYCSSLSTETVRLSEEAVTWWGLRNRSRKEVA